MKKSLMLLVFSAAFMPVLSHAEEGNWMARVRIINVNPSASSSPVSGVDVNSRTVPELDFSYFFTKNVSAELILATARHSVTLNGADLGKLNHLPPTLFAQYHFLPDAKFNPYVGVGVNYTRFYNVDLNSGLDVKRNSTGGALQAGFDISVGKNAYLNFDIKKIYIKTDVTSGGSYLTTLKIDPVVTGIGYGWRF